jgi:hypothetical protein
LQQGQTSLHLVHWSDLQLGPSPWPWPCRWLWSAAEILQHLGNKIKSKLEEGVKSSAPGIVPIVISGCPNLAFSPA